MKIPIFLRGKEPYLIEDDRRHIRIIDKWPVPTLINYAGADADVQPSMTYTYRNAEQIVLQHPDIAGHAVAYVEPGEEERALQWAIKAYRAAGVP